MAHQGQPSCRPAHADAPRLQSLGRALWGCSVTVLGRYPALMGDRAIVHIQSLSSLWPAYTQDKVGSLVFRGSMPSVASRYVKQQQWAENWNPGSVAQVQEPACCGVPS